MNEVKLVDEVDRSESVQAFPTENNEDVKRNRSEEQQLWKAKLTKMYKTNFLNFLTRSRSAMRKTCWVNVYITVSTDAAAVVILA